MVNFMKKATSIVFLLADFGIVFFIIFSFVNIFIGLIALWIPFVMIFACMYLALFALVTRIFINNTY